MRVFIDTEFVEGPQDKKFLGVTYGQTKPTIDLISIGMVAEDGREYYAISKDFNLNQAWKNEWVRENVLKLIFNELSERSINDRSYWRNHMWTCGNSFSYNQIKSLINHYGKTNNQIAYEIVKFVHPHSLYDPISKYLDLKDEDPEFWAYYADYDWVVFCQLFGTMMDLPNGFPKYCKDLKQLMDDNGNWIVNNDRVFQENGFTDLDDALKLLKSHRNYPKQDNEHNALDDARWNKSLHRFLIKL